MIRSARTTASLILTEMAHLPVLLPGAAGVAVAAAVGARAGAGLNPGWYNAVTLAGVTIMLLVPASFATAALSRQRLESSGIASLSRSAPRGVTGACSIPAAAVAVWGLSALVIANLVAAVRLDVSGLPNWRAGLVFALGASAIAAAVLAGTAFARFVQSPITVAVAGVVGVMAILGISSLRNGWSFVSPIYPGSSYYGWNQPNVDLLIRQIGFISGLGLAALLLWTGRSHIRAIAAAGTAGLALASTAWLPNDLNADTVVRTDTQNIRCSAGRLQVCVWRDNEASLRSAAESAERVATAVDGAVLLPERISQPGTVPGRSWSGHAILVLPLTPPDQAAGVGRPDGGTAANLDMLDAVTAAIMPDPPPCISDPRIAEGRRAIYDWIMLRAGAGRLGASDEARRMVRVNLSEQRAWIRSLLVTTAKCP